MAILQAFSAGQQQLLGTSPSAKLGGNAYIDRRSDARKGDGMNIGSLLNLIRSGEIVLPAIQRNFVWPKDKIQKLMDSVLRGYPIGIVLMWETYNDIQYRKFDPFVSAGSKVRYFNNQKERKLKLVLDGQQRLQSLYVALFGSHEEEFLYFDVLSGRDSDDFEEEKFIFEFVADDEAHERNEETVEWVKSDDGDWDPEDLEYLIKVSDLFEMSASEKQRIRRKLIRDLKLSETDELRLENNLARLDEVLTKDQNILSACTIDENKSPASRDRQTESDVLEIFVRINRQGTPLSRSDLIFSMLKLNWNESATALPEFVDSVNKGNSFEIDLDFVIRCLFAVSDLGTRFDVDLLRKKSNIEKMRKSFEQCCEAIQATVDNVQKYCALSSSKALGGETNLIPFVYYLFHCPKRDLPKSQVEAFRKSVFLFGFANPFSRYADSRLGMFIRKELEPRVKRGSYEIPFGRAIYWVNYWERVESWGESLIQRNPRLAMHVVQREAGATTLLKGNAREMDHIFPKSVLREKNWGEAEINHFANFWFLPKAKNINKRARHPNKYLADVSDAELKRALIDRELLNYNRYRKFLKQRGSLILGVLEKEIGLTQADFEEIRISA